MQAIRLVLLFCIIFCAFNACIEPFTPKIGGGEQLIVINGAVTDEEGYQYAEISYTSSFDNPEFNPINDCQAKIIDDRGNEFNMENYSYGKYRTWIEKQYLQTGDQYKIEVVLNNGKKYESEFDTLLPCPDIDRIYFESKNVIPDDPELPPQQGIQFYIDFDATGDYATNYRWEAIETWEYRSEYSIEAIYYGIDSSYGNYRLNIVFLNPASPEDSKIMRSLYICWNTSKIKSIYTYTSNHKTDKKVNGLPLYLITNKDNRLTIKYSILLKQIALTNTTFVYWNQLQTQSQESGGLYNTQPYELKGNIKCIDDENEKVIGIFSASSVKSKRFTTSIHMNRNNYYCGDIIDEWDHLLQYLWGGEPGLPPLPNAQLPDTPLYLKTFLNEYGDIRVDTFSLIDQSCIDCRLKGGTLTKPDFW